MSNDKVAATFHPAARGDGTPAEDVIEPMSVADLRDLIGETAEALDTLVEHAQALRNDNRDVPEGDDLADVVGRLAASWANARYAQTEVARIATVLP